MIDTPQAFVVAIAAAVGACIGSFLNVCILRWPVGQSVVSPRSSCPGCGKLIAAWENIPVISWLLLRGRCSSCQKSISIQYPIIELAVSLIWVYAGLQFGLTLVALNVAVFSTVMLGIGVTDAKSYLIPDGFTIFGLIWLLAMAAVNAFTLSPTPFAPMLLAIIGACTGAGAIAIVGWIGEILLKKDAMGFGDVTLMAVAGAALGPERALLTIFIGAALGVFVFTLFVIPILKLRKSGKSSAADIPLVPFGVFLAPAAVISLIYGETMISWYVSLVFGT